MGTVKATKLTTNPKALMDLVARILPRLEGIAKPQMKFLLAMFSALLCFQGKANRVNLHRYGAPPPRTQYRQQLKAFDFCSFNLAALADQQALKGASLAVMDDVFLKKSGKQTEGLGSFFNGCNSRPERGLQFSVVGLVDPEEKRAYAVDGRQCPAEMPEGQTRLDFSRKHALSLKARLPNCVRHLLVDGAYAKAPFVTGVCEAGFEVVSKLRKDAALRYLYEGPRLKRPGRPKKYDGKVDIRDLSRWESLGEVEEGVRLFSAVLWHDSLKRRLRVACAVKQKGGRSSHILFFTTDLNLSGIQVYEWYKSRFQIEFVFRDGKQHLGLSDGQMRSSKALSFHVNLSLAAVNIMRLSERARGLDTISIASAKIRNYNKLFMFRILSKLGLDPKSRKIQPRIHELSNFGALAS